MKALLSQYIKFRALGFAPRFAWKRAESLQRCYSSMTLGGH